MHCVQMIWPNINNNYHVCISPTVICDCHEGHPGKYEMVGNPSHSPWHSV